MGTLAITTTLLTVTALVTLAVATALLTVTTLGTLTVTTALLTIAALRTLAVALLLVAILIVAGAIAALRTRLPITGTLLSVATIIIIIRARAVAVLCRCALQSCTESLGAEASLVVVIAFSITSTVIVRCWTLSRVDAWARRPSYWAVFLLIALTATFFLRTLKFFLLFLVFEIHKRN